MGSHHRKQFKDPNSPILQVKIPETGRRRRRMADRVDGAPGSGDAYRMRGPRRSTEPLGLTHGETLEAFVAFGPTWEMARWCDSLVPSHSVGRPLRISAVEVLLIEFGATLYGSIRRTVRELHDPVVWRRVCEAAAINGNELPDHPPSRSQFLRFRDRYLIRPEVLQDIRDFNRDFAVRVAETIGLCDPKLGSFTHPDSRNTVVGDGTWLRSPYNRPPDEVLYDEHGERRRRIDPDGVRRTPQDTVTGRDVVSVLARNPFAHERVMLDVCIKPIDQTDADTFVDMVTQLSARTFVQSCAYDMAFDAENHDALLSQRVIPVFKVRRDSQGEPWVQHIDEHQLTLRDGSVETVLVTAADGWPAISLATSEGPKLFALETRRVKPRGPRGRCTFYMTLEVPDSPEVPRRYRGARTMMRINSTPEEVARKDRRTIGLRTFPEGSPVYKDIFGVREDTESMHHHLKSILPNRRARCVGVARQTLMLAAYQSHTNLKALIAWGYRTGADLSAWFGEWRPPPRHQRAAA